MAKGFERHKNIKKYYEAFSGEGKNKIFNTMWDLYYLSFLIGLSANKKTPEFGMGDGTAELDRDMANYAKKKYSLIALLLVLSTDKDVDDTEKLQKLLNEYVDSENNTLNENGFRKMNEYAFAGFEYLEDKISPHPSNAGVLFEKIYQQVSKAFEKKLS